MPKLKFRSFQIEDYARAAMSPGVILGHDTGLGKTLAAFAIPIIKQARRVLIVAPGSLHLQLRETARDKFGVPILPLENQEQFWQWNLDKPAMEREKPVFFFTSYQALGQNGGDEWASDVDDDGNKLETAALREKRLKWVRANLGADHEHLYDKYSAGVGSCASVGSGIVGDQVEDPKAIRCVWTPTLSRLIRTYNSFDSVVVDEGTRLQSNEAKIATGVRLLNPKHRLVLSATPIKNKLDSLFWLAWWAAGGTSDANARWPYAGTSKERERFAGQHLQHDKFVDRESEIYKIEGVTKSVKKRTSRITNIHRLWKLTAPIVLRRRKCDCGEDIVLRRSAVIRCKPGLAQNEVYRHHLLNPPVANGNNRSTAGQQMQLLRMAALCPSAPSLEKAGKASAYHLTPKTLAILALIKDRVAKGEQVMVGSNFTEWGGTLENLLKAAGIRVVLLDGRINPGKRAELARDFKRGLYSVMIGGLQAMGEGHSFDRCANLFLPSLDYAYDVNKQFVDRIWRLTTEQPINVYTFLTEGTVDERLSTLYAEKDESSSLALDGCLRPEDENDEAGVEAVLQAAIEGFRPNAETIPEDTLEAQYEAMKPELRAAQKAFSALRII